MYSKQEMQELRDEMIPENNAGNYIMGSTGRTASYICQTLMYENDPQTIYLKMKNDADTVRGLPVRSTDTDYALAFDMVFGDITTIGRHLADELSTVAKWRAKKTELIEN